MSVDVETICPICLGPVDVPPTLGADGMPAYDAVAAVTAHIETAHPAALGDPPTFNTTPGA